MCQVGDIILVDHYSDNGKTLSKHSFVVIDDNNGTIEGMSYDMICNVLSSFKSEKQKRRKLSYPGNFPIAHDDTVTNPHNSKSGYVKLDQLYYFKKDKLQFRTIGTMNPDILELLFEFLEESDFEIFDIVDNL